MPENGPVEDSNEAKLRSATKGFDLLFANEIVEARTAFAAGDSPFHLLGLGVCAFLEAALGMETGLMTEATRCLTLSEAGAKKQLKAAKSKSSQRFPAGLEWEILHADAVVLLGLTQVLSESYMGYLQCMYSLNSAHSKFTKLYKTVFPNGLADYTTPAASPAPSRKSSNPSLSSASAASTASTGRSGFFKWGSGATLAVPKITAPVNTLNDGPVEEMIVAGTAFGYGLFNLVFSLLPKRIQSVVGFFGFNHDRKLALNALAVSAAKKDVHSVFAGLVLMTYHGVVLLMSGWQADTAHIVKQYQAIVNDISARYPTGALWILNRAKILRMTRDADGAIQVLQDGLSPELPHTFAQADTLLVFELSWCLLQQRRYEEAAQAFIRLTELNSWSHATYIFIAAGCYWSKGDLAKAQEFFDKIPAALEKNKISGKDLPTEVLIKKKLDFYRKKQKRLTGSEDGFVNAIKISPAEELAIFWNTHGHIEKAIADVGIQEWSALTPIVTPTNPNPAPTPGVTPALDTPDELALRALLLGLVYKVSGDITAARAFLRDAHRRQPSLAVSTWIGGVALFELAVLDLRAAEASGAWATALANASEMLDQALALAPSSVDLSTRLDSRITMLRDEIAAKKAALGLA